VLRPTLVAAAVAALYVARLDSTAGLLVDDAWYVVLAKALAQGDGYRLISSAVAPILPVVPPGFPLLLAPVFWIVPQFPDNVWLLKAVSMAAMLATGALVFRHARRDHGLSDPVAALAAVATAITPAFVFLATSTVMAECAFTLFQLAAVVCIERGTAPGAARPGTSVALAGAAPAVALLLRTAGIAVAVACVLFLAWHRRWRQAATYAVIVLLGVLPWLTYARANAPSPEERIAHGGSIAYSYAELLQMRRGGVAASGQAGVADLLTRAPQNLVNVLGRDMGGVFAPALYRGASESGMEVVAIGGPSALMPGSMGGATGTMAVSMLFSAGVLAGLVSAMRRRVGAAELLLPVTLAMVAFVPNRSFRYLLPLAPLLFIYLVKGAQAMSGRHAAPVARVLLLALIGLNALDHGQYLLQARSERPPEWSADAREVDGLLAWMRDNLHEAGAVASTNPGLIYLRTGRLAVASDDANGNWERWKAAGVRYVVALRFAPMPPASLGYRVLYRTDRQKLWVIEM
jgi:hypothetical protein